MLPIILYIMQIEKRNARITILARMIRRAYYNFLIKLLKWKILTSRFDYTWRYVYLKVCSNIIRHLVCIPREFESTWKYSSCSGKVQGQRNFTSQIRTSSIASNHPPRQNELDNKRRPVRNRNPRRPWSRISRRFERGGQGIKGLAFPCLR